MRILKVIILLALVVLTASPTLALVPRTVTAELGAATW